MLLLTGFALLFCDPAAAHDVLQPVVAFVAGELVDLPVVLVHREASGEWPRERRRVVDREFVLQCLRVDAGEALDEYGGSRAEPISLPAAPRRALKLAIFGVKFWSR